MQLRHSFCVKACGTLDGYESPDAKSFRLTGDSEPLNIVLYTYPDKETENVHFTLVDRAAGQNLMKNREVTPHTYLLITDTDGRAYYCISMQFQSDFLLPDGTYTVQMLTDFSAKYVAAEPDVPLDQWDAEGSSSSKTITVTVKDGVPDQPLYTFELIQRPQK